MKIVTLVLTTALSFSGVAYAVDKDTQKFFNEAAIGGMAEVETGKLAASKGQSADVKQFGEMMVKDHSGANEKLKALAAAKKVTLPAELDDKHKKAGEKLAKKEGADFDKAYADQMVKDHKKTIDLFEDEAKKGKDADVKAFAEATLPTLREHLKVAQQLEEKTKK